MRRLLCIILALLSLSFQDFRAFDPSLASVLGLSVAEWLESDEHRALLTILLLGDCAPDAGFSFDSALSGSSYVTGNARYLLLICTIPIEGRIVVIWYIPHAHQTEYVLLPYILPEGAPENLLDALPFLRKNAPDLLRKIISKPSSTLQTSKAQTPIRQTKADGSFAHTPRQVRHNGKHKLYVSAQSRRDPTRQQLGAGTARRHPGKYKALAGLGPMVRQVRHLARKVV